MRRVFALLLLASILPGVLFRDAPRRRNDMQTLVAVPLVLPPQADRQRDLGPFDLQGAWQLTSANSRFTGFSALLAMGGGQLRAFSDRGDMADFPAPGGEGPVRIGPTLADRRLREQNFDSESATRDPLTGAIWIGWEGSNRITSHLRNMAVDSVAAPPAMHDWPANKGPEAMVRLSDGRFIVLCECNSGGFGSGLHPGLLFADAPDDQSVPLRFTLSASAGFRPVDMAQLPDGRVLILMRRLLWPIPARFDGRIVLADPRDIAAGGLWQARQVARLAPELDVDNFEGMAIDPAPDGTVQIWLVSDDNEAITQRTLLWRLVLDPAKL